MMRTPGALRSTLQAAAAAATLALFLAAAAVTAGCNRQEQRPAMPELGAPSAVYTVRGRVTSLPDPASPSRDFQVRHEAIDNFVDSTGRVTGMGAMVMPFPLAEGVSIADLRIGDVVEVEFAVWWQPRRHWEATRIEKLPAETPLEFREARPPQAEPPTDAPPIEGEG